MIVKIQVINIKETFKILADLSAPLHTYLFWQPVPDKNISKLYEQAIPTTENNQQANESKHCF